MGQLKEKKEKSSVEVFGSEYSRKAQESLERHCVEVGHRSRTRVNSDSVIEGYCTRCHAKWRLK